MRRLLSKQSNKSFSTLRKIIVNKTREIKDYESFRGVEFQKHLKQIMLDRKNQSFKNNQYRNLYNKICLTAAKPVETLLNEFLEHSKTYDEDNLVQTTQYMGKAFQISLSDHGGHLDRFHDKLLESPMFDHFIEEVKYALSDKSYTDIANVTKILNSLAHMNYLDIEIIKLVMLKIEKYLNLSKEQSIAFEPRAYQIEKKDYYKSNIIGLDKDLLQNEFFQKNLAYFEQKRKQLAEKLTFMQIENEKLETNSDYQTVVQLLNQFQKFNKGADKFIEGVIAIRQQYRKLVTISANQKVMRNPELNAAALNLEEKLLQMRLITIEDVKNPEAISDEIAEYERVENVVKLIMSFSQIDNFEDYFVVEEKNLEYLNQIKQRELSNFSALLDALAQYSSLPFRLQGTDNKVSLLNVKWQRFFLQDKFNQNNLEVERIFRKAFMETQKFISSNLSALELSFIQGTFQSKIHWYTALIELGFLEVVISQLKEANISNEQVKKFSDKQFLAYLRILNNLYTSDSSLVSENISYIESRLSSILEARNYILNINELCNSINYLYQAQNGSESGVYKNLISQLAEQVNYIERNGKNKQLTRQAKRILFFEDPSAETQNTSLLALLDIENFNSEKSNPYLKAIYDSLNVNSADFRAPFIPTGINKDNEMSGIYLANSNSSSVEGDNVSGHIHAYCLRLHNKFGVKVAPIGFNKFINITNTKEMDSTNRFNIIIKSSDEILEVLSNYMPKNSQLMTEFLKDVGSYLIFIAESSSNNFKIKKLLSRLRRLGSLYKSQKDIFLVNQFYARRCEVLVQLNLLKRDLNLLSEAQVKQAHKKLFKSQESKSLNAIISRIEKQLENPLGKIQSKLKQVEQQKKTKQAPTFQGKRISLNLIKQKRNESPEWDNFETELLNLTYLADYRFVEYQDWNRRLKQTVNVHQIKLSTASELTKLLAMKFCPQAKETIVALPNRNGQLYVPYYPLDWESKYYYHSENKAEKEQLQQIAQGYRQIQKGKQQIDSSLIALQRFKHELKLLDEKQIIKKVLDLECLDNLMIARLSSKQESEGNGKFLKRDAQQYFSYLERRSDKMYLESPYLEYIFNKIEQSENMKDKVKQRKESKIKLQMLFNQGVIDKKQYFQNLKQVDYKLIEQLKKLKRKVLSHIDGVQILEDASKIVQLNQNIDDLSRIVNSAEFYDRNEDLDLASVDGDYEKALSIKRSKAQTNLIIFRILALKAQKKQISKQHQQFFAKWKESVRNGITTFQFDKNYTTQSITQFLTKADKSHFSLKNNNLVPICPDLAASDLLLELNLFFDEAILHQLESQIYGEYFSKKYNVPSSTFQTSSNKRFKKLANKAEDAIFDENAKLNQKELDCLIQMSRIFKTEGVSDREKYNLYYKDFREKLELINKCRYRSPLAIEYLRQKDYEYYRNYLPEDVSGIKGKEVSNLWRKIFHKGQQQVTSGDIRAKVDDICQRMLFIKLSTPPYFGNLVLEILRHEKTDEYTKEKLIAYTELFKVPLQLDSADLESLIASEDNKLEEIMGRMKKFSNENFSKSLYTIL